VAPQGVFDDRKPQPLPRLKGRFLVLVLRGEGIEKNRPGYEAELSAVRKAHSGDLLGGTVWQVGPDRTPTRWPGGAGGEGTFACDEADKAFAAAGAALAWFDSQAELPGMPVVLVWPCDESPDLARPPRPPDRDRGRLEYVVWVGDTGGFDSEWLLDGFGSAYVTRIQGRPNNQLGPSLRFILDQAYSRFHP
jgi:hypothetical protein